MIRLDVPLLPPPGDAPPLALGMFLALAIGTGLLVALVWFLIVQAEITRDQKKELLRKQIEKERALAVACLIEISPGGRKPWQDRGDEVEHSDH